MHPGAARSPSLFRFWLPLLGTWQMMAVEGPFLAAIIARLPDPKIQLAAYGVAYALAIIIESPVIMLMSASTQLVRDRASLIALRRFTLLLNGSVSFCMLVIVLPPVWSRVGVDLLHLPPPVAVSAHTALCWLLPWPAAIGDRRLHQGMLIRAGKTRQVALGTVLRLSTMALVASLAAWNHAYSGAVVAAMALSAGVVAEALAVRWMVRPTVRELRRIDSQRSDLTLPRIWHFYAPLAMTMVLSMAIQPLVTFFLGRSRMALESLAVMPVLLGLTFLFRSWGLSFQEVAIARLGDRGERLPELMRFAAGISLAALAAIGCIVLTPLRDWWFGSLSGLSADLVAFARTPALIVCWMPGLSAWLSLQRALLVHGERTSPLGLATLAELAAIAAVLAIGILWLDAVGAVVASAALLIGRVVSCIALWASSRAAARRLGRLQLRFARRSDAGAGEWLERA